MTNLETEILTALLPGNSHGYAIRKEIEAVTGRPPTIATLYENIARLLDQGMINRAGDKDVGSRRLRKTYRITGLGETALNEEVSRMKWITLRVESSGALPA